MGSMVLMGSVVANGTTFDIDCPCERRTHGEDHYRRPLVVLDPQKEGPIVLYALDIETHGLDPNEAAVVSIAVASPDESVVFDSKNEATLFGDTLAWFTNPHRTRGTIVTWNGAGFDWPYLQTRAQLLGIQDFLDALTLVASDKRMPPYKPLEGHNGGYLVEFAGYDHADVMRPWKPWSKERNLSNALKVVAKANGIDVIEVDRTKIAELSRQELIAYNISDVDATLILAEKLGNDLEIWRDSHLILH